MAGRPIQRRWALETVMMNTPPNMFNQNYLILKCIEVVITFDNEYRLNLLPFSVMSPFW